MTRCLTEPIATLPDGRTLHRCKVCGKEARFRIADSAKVGMQCSDKRRPRSVGLQLTLLLKEIGIKHKRGCGCRKLARWMDVLGVEGCRKDRDLLAKQLRDKALEHYGLAEWTRAIAAAVTSGLALRMNPLDPFGSLIDEAIERAERLVPVVPA